MSVLAESTAWAYVALGTMMTLWRLVPLTLGRPMARRPHRGAHVRPSEFAESGGRRGWRGLQVPLIVVVVGVELLTVNDGVVKWLMLALVIILLPLWEFGCWARSRMGRKSGGPTAEPS